ncbi:helix-turn-helix domain-containing protein [uncultured Cohaesibacter sp.]|uniref:helix-turn-helix domain-containing protein n=1 Tax=uncultured Cohaesibacter sp. TaxID=1002546 RepID=UPI0029C72BEB|nr:helix-turn-helix domain-containing protein [uncultured Cohaesibacter sp.]
MREELALYTPEQTGEILKMATQTLAKWRMTGEGPRFLKFGNRIRYTEKDLLAYINDNTKQHTGQ